MIWCLDQGPAAGTEGIAATIGPAVFARKTASVSVQIQHISAASLNASRGRFQEYAHLLGAHDEMLDPLIQPTQQQIHLLESCVCHGH